MPEVPYTGYSTASPQAPDTPQVRLNVNEAMFGGNVGAAMRQLGTTGEQVGTELFDSAMKLQELYNQTAARKAQSDFIEQAGLEQAKYDALEGQAKVDALQGHIKTLKDIQSNIRGTLTSRNAQNLYDQDSMPFMSRTVFSSAAGAGEAGKQWAIGTAQNTANMAAKSFRDPMSDSEFEEKKDETIRGMDTISGIKNDGLGDSRKLNAVSKLWRGRVEAVAETDVPGSFKMLDKARESGEISQDDSNAVAKFLQARNLVAGAPALARSIYSPDKTMDDMVKEVYQRAPEFAHDDPQFAPAVEAHLSQLASKQKAFKAADDRDTLKTLEDKVIANPNITQEQLLDPDTTRRVNELTRPGVREHILGGHWLIDARNEVTFKQQTDTVTRLMGLARGDPNQVEQFLDTDLMQLGLSKPNLSVLQVERNRVLKSEGDPHLEPAMRTMSAFRPTELEAVGVVPGTPKFDKEQQLRYRGAMAIAVDTWRQEHKGQPPSSNDVRDIIGPSVIRQVTVPGTFGMLFGGNQQPAFNPPQDIVTKWGQDSGKAQEFTDKTGTAPTDDQLRMMYLRKQFMDLYSREQPSGGPASTRR